MHLSTQQIDQYLNGQLRRERHAVAAAHMSLCLHCQNRALRRTGRAVAWERRGRLGRLARRPAADGGRHARGRGQTEQPV
jgi:hypothetical protein